APPAVSASCCQRPGAGHPWPALRTPPVRGTGSGLHRLRGRSTAGRGAKLWLARNVTVHRRPGLVRSVIATAVGPGVEAGGMARGGHGWPGAGTGSRTAKIPAGHPPCLHGGHRSFAPPAQSPSVSSEALPPAAVVLIVTVFSVAKRGR